MARTLVVSRNFNADADGAFPAGFTDLNSYNGVVTVANVSGTAGLFRNDYGNPADARDQYAKITVSGFTGSNANDQVGVCLRLGTATVGGAGVNGYRIKVTDGGVGARTIRAYSVVNGAETQIGTTATLALADGDTVAAEIIDTSLTVYHNDATVTGLTSVTATTHATGNPGIMASLGNNGTIRGDNYEAGNVTAGGGSGSTLTAGTGTFALTGAAANLLFNRAVVASSGSFTLSGADATLIYSGSAATLVADNGSFNLAGTAANLLVGKRLTADGGSFVLTGSDSLSDLSMVASSGSYTLTGGAVTFIYSGSTYTLAANAGSFALTGANAGLIYSGSTYTLAADSGSYALTGANTSFNVSHSIASNAGNFVLTGADVTFTKSTVYTLAADSGAFVYTGRSVNLIYSNAPVIRKKRMNNAITIRLGL